MLLTGMENRHFLHLILFIFPWLFGLGFAASQLNVRKERGLDTTSVNEYDVCNPRTPSGYQPPTVYMELGNTTEFFVQWNNTSNNNHFCHLVFKTCAECRLKIEPVDPKFSYPFCNWRIEPSDGDPCRPGCVYFYLIDNEYPHKLSRTVSKSSDAYGFTSESRWIQIKACAHQVYASNVTMRLRMTSEEKVVYINEGGKSTLQSAMEFKSPLFPDPYVPNSETYKYHITSKINSIIVVVFDDWVVSTCSQVQVINGSFYGNTTVLPNTCQGSLSCCPTSPRPMIVSTGPVMTMIFKTGSNSVGGGGYSFYTGFKASVSTYNSYGVSRIHRTDCGGTIRNSGGTITLDKRDNGQDRDCVWVIRVADNYKYVYLKVIKYDKSGTLPISGFSLQHTPNTLEVRGDLTSEGYQKLKMSPSDGGSDGIHREHFSRTGFYIRLRGAYIVDTALTIAYASYTRGCPSRWNHFLCTNGHCIDGRLKCDNIDHCGDNSDEESHDCGLTTPDISDGRSRGGGNIGIIVPVVVTLFLLVSVITCLLICFVRRCRRMNNETYGRQQRSRGRHGRRRSQNVQMSVTVSSGEGPPSYEEVIRSTPVGYLNMAFTWTRDPDHDPSQLPTYEEATSPTATILQSMDFPDPVLSSGNDTIRNSIPTGNGTSFTPRAISSSADTGNTARATFINRRPQQPHIMLAVHAESYSSSSSSSDDPDDSHRLDSSSSSDSSLDNEISLVQYPREPVSAHSVLAGDSTQGDRNTTDQAPCASESEEVIGQQDVHVSYDTRQLDDHLRQVGDLTVGQGPRNIPIRNVDSCRHNLERPEVNVGARGGHFVSGSRNENRERHASSGERNEHYPSVQHSPHSRTFDDVRIKGRSKYYPQSANGRSIERSRQKRREENISSQPFRDMTSQLKSQSCVDLASGFGLVVPESTEEGKRFSYAGTGDVSLRRDNEISHDQNQNVKPYVIRQPNHSHYVTHGDLRNSEEECSKQPESEDVSGSDWEHALEYEAHELQRNSSQDNRSYHRRLDNSVVQQPGHAGISSVDADSPYESQGLRARSSEHVDITHDHDNSIIRVSDESTGIHDVNRDTSELPSPLPSRGEQSSDLSPQYLMGRMMMPPQEVPPSPRLGRNEEPQSSQSLYNENMYQEWSC